MPVLFDATKDIRVPIYEKVSILSMGIGVIIKIVYAFLYQERQLPSFITSFFDHQFMIRLGARAIPFVNFSADLLTGFKQTDHEVNGSYDVYPGQSFCKMDQAHSIWHEVSANGLLDLVYLCDHTKYLMQAYRIDLSEEAEPALIYL